MASNLDAANAHVLKFDERVANKVKAMQANWTFEEKEGIIPLLENEKETVELLLQGLKPYLCVPVDERDAFLKWQSQLESAKESKTDLQERVLGGQVAPKENSNLKKTKLLIWPYVLVFALSLKFAKGVAGLKSIFSGKTDQETTNANDEETAD